MLGGASVSGQAAQVFAPPTTGTRTPTLEVKMRHHARQAPRETGGKSETRQAPVRGGNGNDSLKRICTRFGRQNAH